MHLNQIYTLTPSYVYILSCTRLFIGFSLCFNLGYILHIRTRRIVYYFLSFALLFIPFLYEIKSMHIHSGTRSLLFYSAIFLIEFFLTKEDWIKKLKVLCIVLFFNGFLEFLCYAIYWKLICSKLLHLPYVPYITVPNQKISTILIFFLPVACIEIALNFIFPELWKRYLQFIDLTTFVEIILLPGLCSGGYIFIFPELFGKIGWILVFLILLFASILFFYSLQSIPDILNKIQENEEKKRLIKKQITEFTIYQEENLALRKQNHDIINHIQALSFLLSENRINEALKYIKELQEVK